MKRRPNSHLRVVASALAVLLVLAGCSSKESGSAGTSKTTAGESTGETGKLTASDVGVTEDTITIAYSYPDIREFVKQGLVDDIVPYPEQLQPILDAVNKDGGINGRKLQIRPVTWDATAFPASLVDACTQIAEDNPNFITVSPSFFGDGASCLAGDNGIPLLTMSGMAGTVFNEISDNTFLFNLTFEEAQRSMVTALSKAGKLKGLKLAAIARDEPGGPEAIEKGLRPALEKAGLKLTDVVVIAGTGDDASYAAAVKRLQGAKVDGVIVTTNVTIASAIVSEADRQGYHPQWLGSDQSEFATGAIGESVPKGSLDGALGVTFRRAQSDTPVKPTAQDKECVAERNTIDPKLPEAGSVSYGAYTQVCAMFKVAIQAMRDAGPNLTRDGLVKALQSIDDFDLGTGKRGGFTAKRHVAPREVQMVKFSDSCACWQAAGDVVSID